jgi:hypothetical protein
VYGILDKITERNESLRNPSSEEKIILKEIFEK